PELAAWMGRYGYAINTPAELRDFVSGGDGRNEPADIDVLTPNVLKQAQLTQSDSNHNYFDIWQAPENIKVTQIVGWGLDTVSGFKYVGRDKKVCEAIPPGSPYIYCKTVTYLDHEPIFTEDGDETVVTPSAGSMATTTFYLDLPLSNKGPRVNRVHSSIMESISVRDLLGEILIRSTSTLPSFIATEEPTKNILKKLRIRVLSPVSISVTDSFGSQTDLINENIPNSYYLEFGEGKYVGLDTEDTYTLRLDGQDTGTFTLGIDEVSGDQVTDTLIYQDIPVTPDTIVTMTIGTLDTASNLNIDINGDGNVDQTLAPGTTVTTIDRLNTLKIIVSNLDLDNPNKKSMLAKINDAIGLVKKGNLNGAEHKLGDLQNQLQALSDKKLTIEQATELMQIIETIKNTL
ncbi:MAG: hypothetical protein AAB590_02430, partial [Patescibacteria group bacterium]